MRVSDRACVCLWNSDSWLLAYKRCGIQLFVSLLSQLNRTNRRDRTVPDRTTQRQRVAHQNIVHSMHSVPS